MKVYVYLLDTLADWEIGFITAELYSHRYFDKNKEPIDLIKENVLESWFQLYKTREPNCFYNLMEALK